MNGAIVLHEPTSPMAAVSPRGIEDVFRLANVAAKSGLYGVKTPEDAFIRMATGMELGLSAIQSLRSVVVINGRPSLSAELMVALCLGHPECECFELVETTAAKATWRTVRRGRETTLSWTIEQAQKAGLANGNVWKAYPDTMLRWRCASALAKAVYPERMMGLLSTEEAQSISPHAAAAITPDGEVLEPHQQVAVRTPEDSAKEFAQAIASAQSNDELDQLAKSIKMARLPKELLLFLSGKSQARRKELEMPPPPAAEPSQPATDESEAAQ